MTSHAAAAKTYTRICLIAQRAGSWGLCELFFLKVNTVWWRCSVPLGICYSFMWRKKYLCDEMFSAACLKLFCILTIRHRKPLKMSATKNALWSLRQKSNFKPTEELCTSDGSNFHVQLLSYLYLQNLWIGCFLVLEFKKQNKLFLCGKVNFLKVNL